MKLRQQDDGLDKANGSNAGEHHRPRKGHVMEVEGSSPSLRTNFPTRKRWRVTWAWAQKLGNEVCPYLIRWYLATPFGSVRLHHWNSSDDARNFHDHPWWFVTLVLRGGYTDVSPAGEDRCPAGRICFRPALHQHTVRVDKGGCWTILLTGPEFRFWGFWIRHQHTPASSVRSPRCKHCGLNESYWAQFPCRVRFKKANKYFLEHGHHPCATKD